MDAVTGEHPRSNRNAEDVVKERPKQVLLDLAQGRPADRYRPNGIHQVTAHQDNIAGLFGDIGAAADGNADLCLSEGGRIIDPVTHHPDDHAATLVLFDHVTFAVRHHFCFKRINSRLLRDDGSNIGVITGNHAGGYAHAAQFGNSFDRIRSQSVRKGCDANQCIAGRDIHQ